MEMKRHRPRRSRSHREKMYLKKIRRLGMAMENIYGWFEKNCLLSSTTILSDGRGNVEVHRFDNKDLQRALIE